MRGRFFIGFLVWLFGLSVWASQSYVPPPPPNLPTKLSSEMVEKGRNLFLRNTWVDGRVEIHNYLGRKACARCHDQPTPLKSQGLTQNFGSIRSTINREIRIRAQGTSLPPEDPAMEALVQYLVHRYKLHQYKVPK